MRDLSTLIAFIINFVIIASYSMRIKYPPDENSLYELKVDTNAFGFDFIMIVNFLGFFFYLINIKGIV